MGTVTRVSSPGVSIMRCADTPPSSRVGRQDPQEDFLAGPHIYKSSYVLWSGRAVIEHTPTHWGCILTDRTVCFDERPNRSPADKYLLRSELFACVPLLRRQINETLWDVWEQEFTGWKVRVGDSPVKVGDFGPYHLCFGYYIIDDPKPCARVRLSASKIPAPA